MLSVQTNGEDRDTNEYFRHSEWKIVGRNYIFSATWHNQNTKLVSCCPNYSVIVIALQHLTIIAFHLILYSGTILHILHNDMCY